MGLRFSINGAAVGRGAIASRIKRKLNLLLNAIGDQSIIACIKSGKFLTDFIAEEKKYKYKAQVLQYWDIVSAFTDDEVFNWVSPQHKTLIESVPGGRDWAARQIAYLRRFLTP